MKNMMLQVKNVNKVLLAALLIGAASPASAWESCGTNIEYEIVGTVLQLRSPNPTQAAKITSAAFKDKQTITEVVIPANVDEIKPEAFYGCTSLVSVLCRPQTAPTLGQDAFTCCNESLQICVPALGAYNNHTNWNSYEEKLTLCFLDENDDETVTTAQIKYFRGTCSSIDIFRTLRKAGCFNTLTLPFSVPNIASSPLGGDNVEVYTFTSATVEGGKLVLTIEKVTSNSLSAGTPYLIQWNNTGAELNRMHFTGITWDTDQQAETASSTDVNYVGFYGKTQITDDASHSNLFLKGSNTLYWPAAGDTSDMLGFRAYFHVNTSSPAPLYRGMPTALRINSTPSDIETVQADDMPRKQLQNGQIIIIRNGEKYSINGQKL